MIKSKFGIIFDCFVISFIFFILSFSWFYRIIKIRFLSIIFSFLIFIISFFICLKLSIKKYKISKISNKDNKIFKNSIIKLKYASKKENSEFFEKLFNAKAIKNDILKNENSYFYINLNTKMTSIDFVLANNFYLETNKKLPLCFIAESLSEEFLELTKESPIKYSIFFSDDLFSIMKSKQIYPKDIQINENSKKHFLKKRRLKFIESLSKARFKDFFFTGLSLVIMSIIVPYSLYYLVSGSILLLFSFLCLILKRNKNNFIETERKLKDFCN